MIQPEAILEAGVGSVWLGLRGNNMRIEKFTTYRHARRVRVWYSIPGTEKHFEMPLKQFAGAVVEQVKQASTFA